METTYYLPNALVTLIPTQNDKIEAINNKLIEFKEFLYEQEMLTIRVDLEKIK